MQKVGVRELKEQGSQILRRVREDGERFEVTYHGRVVAWLVPVHESESKLTVDEWIAKGDELAAEIGKYWPPGLSAAQAISEDRNRLEP